jgi:uncharacterized protein (DUF885 family)
VAKAFKRKGDRFVARLDSLEREVVAGLLEQTRDFLAPAPRAQTGDPFDDLVASMGMPSFQEATDPRLEGPRDPALERLLPSANREDEAVAAEFRRLTEQGLRERKTANLTTAADALRDADGDKVVLSAAQAQALVVALTDVRLLLGERLGLRTDDDAEELAQRLDDADQDDPAMLLAAYYDFMTWLQESLTQSLMS